MRNSQRFKKLFFINALFLISMNRAAFATDPFCADPITTAPALSFSLASFHPGDLDRSCRVQIAKAKQFGITGVNLVPAFSFDRPNNGSAVFRSTANTNEITRCLDAIWSAGMTLIFQPHLEAQSTLDGGRWEMAWRAEFDFAPNANYYQSLFGEFMDWLENHRQVILADQRTTFIVGSAELEKSTALYPSEWTETINRLRATVARLGLTHKIQIGINPNYWPNTSVPAAQCRQYRAFIEGLDFLAFSFYGDWSQTGLGARQPEVRKTAILREYSRAQSQNCSVPQVQTRPFAIGEFGVGPVLEGIEADQPINATHRRFLNQRRTIFSNLLTWARRTPTFNGASSLPISLWTIGIFDPVGVSDPTPGQAFDPGIVALFRSYTSHRCRGIRFTQ